MNANSRGSIVELVLDVLWYNIHTGTMIICACLPSYRPLLTKSIAVVTSSIQKYSLPSAKAGSGANSSRSRNKKMENNVSGPFSATSDGYKSYVGLGDDDIRLVESQGSLAPQINPNRNNSTFTAGGIKVQRTVEVV